jgi:myosin heavy subunit
MKEKKLYGINNKIKLKTRRKTNIDHFGQTQNLYELCDLEIDSIIKILEKNFYSENYFIESTQNTLITINPIQPKPKIYSQSVMNFYYNEFFHSKYSLDKILKIMPAHIFKHASIAWKLIHSSIRNFETENQTLLVSGDSGSGKTSTINYILSFYSYLTHRNHKNMANCETERSSSIKDILLETNQILESFGNARTSLNNNSSRFGKYIKLYFDHTDKNKLVTANILTYLLEKSRSTTTTHKNLTYNFHIFYELLFGSNQAEKESFHITENLLENYGPTPDHNDRIMYAFKLESIKKSFNLIDIPYEEVFGLISAIANLNCSKFTSDNNYSSSFKIQISDETWSHFLASSTLFAFENFKDFENYLFIHEIKIKSSSSDVIKKPCNQNQASQRKNCFIKLVYNELFKWLVQNINKKLSGQFDLNNSNELSSSKFIGLLDIYGFENLNHLNCLEQLCINYANEKLHQFYIDSYFKILKTEFQNECLEFECNSIAYNDNIHLINLIESSLFSLINEQSILNR